MSPRKFIAAFLITFLILGQGCYAENIQDATEKLDEATAAVSDAAVETPEEPEVNWSEGWYEGASGYEQALTEYERTNTPMAVYVNVSWCPYCRKFEKEVLSNPKVMDFMKDLIKVRINPETSKHENAITFQYGVTGFPSFYVHPPQPSGTIRLYTGVTPEQFIEFFQKALK